MNDVTPRKMRGTLLERAAALYGFDAQFQARDETPERHTETASPSPFRASGASSLSQRERRVESGPRSTDHAGGMVDPTLEGAHRVGDGKGEGEFQPKPYTGPVTPIDRAHLAEHGYLVPGAPVSVLAEEFRLVKRQLLLTARKIADAGRARSRLILVCSAKPGEGKTFSSINLALSLAAERDVEVLLVDGDFAKPDVMASLGLGEGPGLLDALADPAIDLESLVVHTDIPKLSLLPAGTRSNDDTELLASERTDALLAGLVEADPRRIVIFDSPPALAASPASVLAAQVGQVMLVVRADRTGENDLREAVQLLDGCEYIQLVLNAVSYSPGGARFGTYYGHYGQEDSK
jgi:exopolysaccharide/PEP-CTERM locus tyrosine autokinase